MSLSISSRINDVLYTIHKDIAADLSARNLAQVAALSEQHFHRVFKAHLGEPLHRYVCRIRLEQAANQLMFDFSDDVQSVAHKCGFQSLSSFSRAFKAQHGMPPGQWRKQHQLPLKPDFYRQPTIAAAYEKVRNLPLPRPQILETKPVRAVYLRHKGYSERIRETWQQLLAWTAQHGCQTNPQYALYHSNPACVPLDECRYVACVGYDKPLLTRSFVNILEIPGGLHARFQLKGHFGEFVAYMSRILSEWAPGSGFKTRTTPAWVHYRQNQFIDSEQAFDLDLYIPLSFYY